MAESKVKKIEYQPPLFIQFTGDGSKAELVPNPPATPKGIYTYKYYHSDYATSTLPGTTIPFDETTIKSLMSRNTIIKLDNK